MIASGAAADLPMCASSALGRSASTLPAVTLAMRLGAHLAAKQHS
ncbi:hypothetical protein USDA257_c21870 [Sinorhizobium fredii USDA 257]|uniref:Uncharacterized protein n=1 Tax=Sinorhizobium fredii (strain USDA 257) TaxID=1185652 RepID=I3X4G3_SINF2|nr:hypothetical protein USDA257_c21870 [Sinorhizobium fredii USDA 257]